MGKLRTGKENLSTTQLELTIGDSHAHLNSATLHNIAG